MNPIIFSDLEPIVLTALEFLQNILCCCQSKSHLLIDSFHDADGMIQIYHSESYHPLSFLSLSIACHDTAGGSPQRLTASSPFLL